MTLKLLLSGNVCNKAPHVHNNFRVPENKLVFKKKTVAMGNKAKNMLCPSVIINIEYACAKHQ